MVRGGGSVAERVADLSAVEGQGARCSVLGPAGFMPPLPDGMMVPGQTAAQSGAQFSAQQSIPSWPPAICEAWAIGQSGEGKANAGPDAMARDRASQIRAKRRHTLTGIGEEPLGGNARRRFRPFTSRTIVHPQPTVSRPGWNQARRPQGICGASPVRCAVRHNVLGNAADLASHLIVEPRTKVIA